MTNLTRFEQVVQEHVCLYIYSIRMNTFNIFSNVRLIKNTLTSDKPLYYCFPDNDTKYFVLPDNGKIIHSYNGTFRVLPEAGKVLHCGCGFFKVWLAEADDSAGVKLLLNSVNIYTTGKIKKAYDTIVKMQNYQDLAHEILDCMIHEQKRIEAEKVHSNAINGAIPYTFYDALLDVCETKGQAHRILNCFSRAGILNEITRHPGSLDLYSDETLCDIRNFGAKSLKFAREANKLYKQFN